MGIYLEKSLDDSIFNIPNTDESLVVRVAEKKDIEKIKTNIFPYLTARDIDNDGRYFNRIGDDDFTCFIAEKDGSVVHFFLVYENALNSPLTKTPFNKSIIQDAEAYLGNTFTIPEARGLWIAPISLSIILLYLRDTVKAKKAYVLVHKDTPGADAFYKKLGFNVIKNACNNRFFDFYYLIKNNTGRNKC